MSIRDLVCVAIGEILLAATFVLGVCVGVALTTRKESSNGNCNEGTIRRSPGWTEWRDVERR